MTSAWSHEPRSSEEAAGKALEARQRQGQGGLRAPRSRSPQGSGAGGTPRTTVLRLSPEALPLIVPMAHASSSARWPPRLGPRTPTAQHRAGSGRRHSGPGCRGGRASASDTCCVATGSVTGGRSPVAQSSAPNHGRPLVPASPGRALDLVLESFKETDPATTKHPHRAAAAGLLGGACLCPSPSGVPSRAQIQPHGELGPGDKENALDSG